MNYPQNSACAAQGSSSLRPQLQPDPTANQCAREPELWARINFLESQLANLGSLVLNTRERLEPVMRPSVPEPTAKDNPVPISTGGMSLRIGQLSGLADDIYKTIDDINNRLEI